MEQDFFTNLPSEITTNILSRLPLRTVAISKCVCKPWLHLLETEDFAKSHLSKTKTSPALAVLTSTRCSVFDFEDEDGVDLDSHDRHYNPFTNFDFPRGDSSMEGTAADAFLLLFSNPKTLYICNPVTRDYVELCCPLQPIPQYGLDCGFGVSKISGQHKVVCISPVDTDYHHVYTLETKTWRLVEPSATFGYSFYENTQSVCNFGKFVNGNLHWTVTDPELTRRICCFDVETECFSIFTGPIGDGDVELPVYGELSVLRDCLCVSSISWDEVIYIWLMKEFGVEKSWTMEYILNHNPPDSFGNSYVCVYRIKVFKDGDILMLLDEKLLITRRRQELLKKWVCLMQQRITTISLP